MRYTKFQYHKITQTINLRIFSTSKFDFFKFILRSLLFLPGSLFAQIQSENYFQKISTKSNNELTGFIKNEGQVAAMEGGECKNVLFTFSSSNGDVDIYITNKGISYVYKKLKYKVKTARALINNIKRDSNCTYHFEVERIDQILKGATININNTVVEYSSSNVVFNYYSSIKAITGQKIISKITFKNIYKNIDWVVYSKKEDNIEKIKYDFILHEGASLESIKIIYSRNASLTLNKDMSLSVKGKLGFITEGVPIIINKYPTADPLLIYYKVKNNEITYKTNKKLNSFPVIIDPDLYWGTYLHTLAPYTGLHGSEVKTTDVATDSSGNIFVSLSCDGVIKFPTLNIGNGAYYNDVYDNINGSNVYMKFTAEGVMLWSTYFAGGGGGGVITIDKHGNLFAASGFRTTVHYLDNGGYFDSTSFSFTYLAKFNNDGILLWCTKWAYEELYFTDIVCDEDDNLYIAGTTTSSVLPKKDPGNGAYFESKSQYGGHFFISKFNNSCGLVWSTEVDNTQLSYLYGRARLATDKDRNVYLMGASLTKFDASCKQVWKKGRGGNDLDVDADGNIYLAGFGNGAAYNYVDPGNGAYIDTTHPQYPRNNGSIRKLDPDGNVLWATTYYNPKFSFFEYIVYEKARNLIHIYGYMNDPSYGFPTINDDCNGNFYSSTSPISVGPVLLTFTTGGKRLYTSLTKFPYSYYDEAYSEMTVDNKGNLIYIFSGIQESPGYIPFPGLKNPGNGAYYQEASNNYLSQASFIMKLQPTLLSMDTVLVPPSICNCNGSITLTPKCGTGPYIYEWSRGDNTAQLKNVCPGKYSVKVTDQGSHNSLHLDFVFANPPNSVSKANFVISPEHCNQHEGNVLIKNVYGGSPPYNFSLNNQPYTNTNEFKNLKEGKYVIAIKDNNGCIITDTVVVNNIPGPSVIFLTQVPSSCNKPTGSITIDSLRGGISPYMYSINNSGFGLDTLFTNLNAGKYNITLKDSAGCLVNDSIIVTQFNPPLRISVNIENAHCGHNDGKIIIDSVNGGQAPYMFSTDNIFYKKVSLIDSVFAGKYFVYVKDGNNCMRRDSVVVPDIPPPYFSLGNDTAICRNENILLNGNITSGVTYLWNDGNTAASRLINIPAKYWLKATRGICTFTDTINITVAATPTVNLGTDTILCEGQQVLLDAHYTDAMYKWQDGSTQPFFVVSSPGLYYVTANIKQCKISDSISVNYLPIPVVNIGSNVEICQGQDFVILPAINTAVNYLWQDGSKNEKLKINKAGPVVLKVNNKCGSATDSIMVSYRICELYLPSAFTPNDDGINDIFRIKYPFLTNQFKFTIYNRWGIKVFETDRIEKGWNGSFEGAKQPEGTYIWQVSYIDSNAMPQYAKGTVNLIR